MMTSDFERIRSFFPEGTGVLCAVSGGADSVCLLHILASNRDAWNIRVFAVHYEHGIRGEESLRDCRFVETLCDTLGVPLTVEHGDVPRIAVEQGKGLEEAARDLRYDFLQRTAEELNCDWIATAHNADDNAETILLNLVRGAGAAGLRGIPPRRGKIVRPLLPFSRDEIEIYLRENRISHVEDGTNASDEYSRNLLRHQVMPVLRQLNPNFSGTAANTSELMRRDEDFIDAEAGRFLAEHEQDGKLPLAEFRSLHPAVAGRVIRRMCPESLSMEAVDRVIAMAEKDEIGCVDLPGIRVRSERGKLRFGEQTELGRGEYHLIPGEPIDVPEVQKRIESEFVTFSSEIHNSFKTYYLKCENICGDILITGRRDGDKLRPSGRNCTKTLKNLFLEAKLDTAEKNRILVLRDEKGILAVPGIAIAQRCIPMPGERVLKITIQDEK